MDTRRANAEAQPLDPDPSLGPTYFERASSRRAPVARSRDPPTSRQQRNVDLHCLLDDRNDYDVWMSSHEEVLFTLAVAGDDN